MLTDSRPKTVLEDDIISDGLNIKFKGLVEINGPSAITSIYCVLIGLNNFIIVIIHGTFF